MNALGKHGIAVSVIALSLTLVGCGPTPSPDASAGPSPDSSTSAEASASPSVDPRDSIASIVIDGDSLTVYLSEGGAYLDIPFTTTPVTAVDHLSEALRVPATISTLPSNTCFSERQQASWGGLTFTWGNDWQRPTTGNG